MKTMDHKNIETNITAAGVTDTPEPVGVAGALAGPPRPSSSDCREHANAQNEDNSGLESDNETDNDYVEQDEVFGEDEDKGSFHSPTASGIWTTSFTQQRNSFSDLGSWLTQVRKNNEAKRAEKEPKTPVRLEKSPTEIFSSPDDCKEDSIKRSKKRKAMSPLEVLTSNKNPLLVKTINLAEKLAHFAKGTKNVHKEVKNWSKELYSLVKQINLSEVRQSEETDKKIENLKAELRECQSNMAKYKLQMMEQIDNLKVERTKVEVCVQTESSDTIEKQMVVRKSLEDKLKSMDTFRTIVNWEWDDSMYVKIGTTEGNPMEYLRSHNVVILNLGIMQNPRG